MKSIKKVNESFSENQLVEVIAKWPKTIHVQKKVPFVPPRTFMKNWRLARWYRHKIFADHLSIMIIICNLLFDSSIFTFFCLLCVKRVWFQNFIQTTKGEENEEQKVVFLFHRNFESIIKSSLLLFIE